MKKLLVLIALFMILPLCLVACDTNSNDPQETTEDVQSGDLSTEAPTTEAPTTEEPTTEEPTTEAKVEIVHPSREVVKDAAVTFLDADAMREAANNPQQDWSDFGGLTENEDGSVTLLFRMGTNDVWDPYCYLLKQPTTVGDVMVIKYQVNYDFRVSMYMGSEGNAATGAGDHVVADIFATAEGEWNYLVLNMAQEAGCYDQSAAALGYLRLGLMMAESGDTITIDYVAFFNDMNEVNDLIPY